MQKNYLLIRVKELAALLSKEIITVMSTSCFIEPQIDDLFGLFSPPQALISL